MVTTIRDEAVWRCVWLCVVHLDDAAAGCVHVPQPRGVGRLSGPGSHQHIRPLLVDGLLLTHSHTKKTGN